MVPTGCSAQLSRRRAMFSFRWLSYGLAFVLSLGWLMASPGAAHAQFGFGGAPMIRDRDNCGPSRYQLYVLRAQMLQAQQGQLALANQIAGYQYQQAMLAQQMAFQQQMAMQQQ